MGAKGASAHLALIRELCTEVACSRTQALPPTAALQHDGLKFILPQGKTSLSGRGGCQQ